MSISKVCAETMTHCDGDAHLGHYYLNRRHADVLLPEETPCVPQVYMRVRFIIKQVLYQETSKNEMM